MKVISGASLVNLFGAMENLKYHFVLEAAKRVVGNEDLASHPAVQDLARTLENLEKYDEDEQ
jgi:hypothetical protein